MMHGNESAARLLVRGMRTLIALACVLVLVGGSAVTATPPPTPRPTERQTPRPERTPRPAETPAPTETAAPTGPEQTSITIGYRQADLAGVAPLVLADARAYFSDAGLTEVELINIEQPLMGVLNGELTFGVVDAIEAATAFSSGLPLNAVAGYHNYQLVTEAVGSAAQTDPSASPAASAPASVPPAPTLAYGGDLLAVNTDFATANPNTVQAFTAAYIQALRDLQDPANDEELFGTAEAAGITVTEEARAAWSQQVQLFQPFDGGFGAVDQGGGLGELEAYLVENLGEAPDLTAFILLDALNASQADLGLPPNPDPAALGAALPEQLAIAVGVRSADLESQAPLLWARQRGYFSQAGFADVALQEAGDALPALTGGELHLGVVDLVAAANAVAGGQAVQAIAGYRNYAGEGGAYGGDVIAATSEFVAQNPNTARAFTLAYIRALRDLQDPATAEELFATAEAAGLTVSEEARAAWTASLSGFAPFDGGFGDGANGGGLAELATYLTDSGVAVPDGTTFISWASLNGAQADLGLPANPDAAAAGIPLPSPVPEPVPSPIESAATGAP
jgi:ABC-type nitrate/sulfonate/bicarbonate transport system substrate-binding protein